MGDWRSSIFHLTPARNLTETRPYRNETPFPCFPSGGAGHVAANATLNPEALSGHVSTRRDPACSSQRLNARALRRPSTTSAEFSAIKLLTTELE